eukprot:10977392-Alexandrium_andersonii.AAC.1
MCIRDREKAAACPSYSERPVSVCACVHCTSHSPTKPVHTWRQLLQNACHAPEPRTSIVASVVPAASHRPAFTR